MDVLEGGGVVVDGGGVVDGVVEEGGLVVVVVGGLVVVVVVGGFVVLGVVVEVSVSIDDVVVDVAEGNEVVSLSDMVVGARLSIYIEEYQSSVPVVSQVKAQRRLREGIENVALLPEGFGTAGYFS